MNTIGCIGCIFREVDLLPATNPQVEGLQYGTKVFVRINKRWKCAIKGLEADYSMTFQVSKAVMKTYPSTSWEDVRFVNKELAILV